MRTKQPVPSQVAPVSMNEVFTSTVGTTALILDAHLKSSLAAIRTLGKRGIPIIAASHRGTAMGLQSRYVTDTFVYPSPLQDRSGFTDAVVRYTSRAGPVVLLAFSDASLLPLLSSEHFENKLWTYLLPASRENFEIALDKSRTLKLAQEVGVEIPITHICTPEDDLAAIAGDMEYPVVVKPRRSVSWNGNTGVQTTAMFAFSADELKQKCSAVFSRTGEFPLIQEFVRGEEASVQFMCEDGRVIGACANRRLRSVWPHGGPGVLKETVPLSYRGLGERARCIARKLQWSGPIMIEFKIDQASGVPKLMEVNGRFWGSLPLAITAGSDFPHQYYRLARGEEVTPTVEYQTGVISRHFLADVKNLLWTLFKRHPLRSFAYPARLRAIKDFLIVPKNCRSDVMDIRDMKPVFAEMFYALSRIRSMWSVGEE